MVIKRIRVRHERIVGDAMHVLVVGQVLPCHQAICARTRCPVDPHPRIRPSMDSVIIHGDCGGIARHRVQGGAEIGGCQNTVFQQQPDLSAEINRIIRVLPKQAVVHDYVCGLL